MATAASSSSAAAAVVILSDATTANRRIRAASNCGSSCSGSWSTLRACQDHPTEMYRLSDAALHQAKRQMQSEQQQHEQHRQQQQQQQQQSPASQLGRNRSRSRSRSSALQCLAVPEEDALDAAQEARDRVNLSRGSEGDTCGAGADWYQSANRLVWTRHVGPNVAAIKMATLRSTSVRSAGEDLCAYTYFQNFNQQ